MRWPLLDSCASKALLSNYRKEGVFLLCIFRVQETVNRVSSRRLRLSHIFHLHRKLYSTNSISAGKIGMHGFFLLQGCYCFLKLRIQQHCWRSEKSIWISICNWEQIQCAQQRAKNVSKYSNILMPSRASSYSASMLMILLRRRKSRPSWLLSYMQRLLKYESPPFIPSWLNAEGQEREVIKSFWGWLLL